MWDFVIHLRDFVFVQGIYRILSGYRPKNKSIRFDGNPDLTQDPDLEFFFVSSAADKSLCR